MYRYVYLEGEYFFRRSWNYICRLKLLFLIVFLKFSLKLVGEKL